MEVIRMKTGVKRFKKTEEWRLMNMSSPASVLSIAFAFLLLTVFGLPDMACAVEDAGPGPGPGTIETASTVDAAQACRAEVEKFLTAWTVSDYSAMQAMLGEAGNGGFIDSYRGHEAEAGRLFAYTIRDAVPAGEKVLVATALKFRTEVPPKTTSSLHSFSMKKDGAFCRIADITPISPPAPSRQPGGTFPSD
jgi:hypothetical protein